MKTFWEKLLAILAVVAGGFGLYQMYSKKKLAKKLVKERNARAEEELEELTDDIEERKVKYEKLKARAGISSRNDDDSSDT